MKPAYYKKGNAVYKIGGVMMPASYPADKVSYDQNNTIKDIVDTKATGEGLAFSVDNEGILCVTYDDGT